MFSYTANPARVVFGGGALATLPEEVRRLGLNRILLVASPARAEPVAEVLGPLLAARFHDAATHTPVEVTRRALELAAEHEADGVVALGGGSATGLAKAIALRTGLPQLIVPTTYSGSEMTSVLGETADGRKTTRSSPKVRPEVVLYDVDLTLGLPVGLSVTSGVNALAHAVEALYSPQANPIVDGFALEAIRLLAAALPRIAADPSDVDARTDALRAAWLAGSCLGSVGMSLHHKLCHTLGGSFGLPHAETHTVVLPQAMAYNASAAPEAMRRIARALGAPDAATGVHDLVAGLPAPRSLAELGLAEGDLAEAAELATAAPYANPREVTREGIEALLRRAWAGDRPAASPGSRPDVRELTGQVVGSFAATPDPRLRGLLSDLVRTLHSYVLRNDLTQDEWEHAIGFLTRTGQISGDRRQEFILLSDTLGVSSVVDVLTHSRTPDTTPSAVLGPFYVPGPPETEQGADLAEGLPGTPLWTDVRVTDLEDAPVAGAVVDVWQSDEDGFYDVQRPEAGGPVLRARFRTDEEGRLRFWTIVPSAYPIPADGPVGRMLDAVGRHPYRAPHVHFMIAHPGFRTLVTQLFVRGGDYLGSDTVFGVKDGLIVDFAEQRGPAPDGRDPGGRWRRLDFTFRISPTR
ncbi:maleylacetate reductase and hydroxyquinol 1,2-dioxygenase domain-containing protein [Amycolatopsis sp. PS_44_ISF1]|uniref:maleylacetate reductase and hydroxyquinol 1,2-dioxygenase domain-containing protein n=1 Tax=Amycolatopsis sp. PS_44_ISF1 TaxID=2974917 RepID=UPI0028DF9E58|nr:maleylacetate reductase and hydroxyquinol 1,2-dioxygenase domain-containing protein [Amycolatopsis sp. PS_44_ISF1]MDT8915332.1 maleylacetate reductase and hydroxyquinol 1,2-dioxygenase domain-containing protein [Amycolatopsis sp. PS_44_ISF1]